MTVPRVQRRDEGWLGDKLEALNKRVRNAENRPNPDPSTFGTILANDVQTGTVETTGLATVASLNAGGGQFAVTSAGITLPGWPIPFQPVGPTGAAGSVAPLAGQYGLERSIAYTVTTYTNLFRFYSPKFSPGIVIVFAVRANSGVSGTLRVVDGSGNQLAALNQSAWSTTVSGTSDTLVTTPSLVLTGAVGAIFSLTAQMLSSGAGATGNTLTVQVLGAYGAATS